MITPEELEMIVIDYSDFLHFYRTDGHSNYELRDSNGKTTTKRVIYPIKVFGMKVEIDVSSTEAEAREAIKKGIAQLKLKTSSVPSELEMNGF